MKTTREILNNYVDISDIDIKDVAHMLSIRGVEAESFILGAKVDGIVVSKIEKIEAHPDADKLRVCQVNIGKDENIQIVTNAKNAFEGMILPLATVGTNFGGGFKIKKGKLRGVESLGMFCSKVEFGLAKESAGVWNLSEEFKITDDDLGKNVYDFVKLTEGIEIEITPNRPDVLCLTGLAREIGAIYGRKWNNAIATNRKFAKDGSLNIDIKDSNNCSKYSYAKIKNVKVGESPAWLKTNLEAMGISPINNIVDITNFMMFELNQPMHAFDATKIDNDITIDWAEVGSSFISLDDVKREIKESVLAVKSNGEMVAAAGVIGGSESAISQATTSIVLECAHFDAVVVRKSKNQLDVSTDSSYRFERGISQETVEFIMNRAIDLVLDIAGGELVEVVEKTTKVLDRVKVEVNIPEMCNLLDISLDNSQIRKIIEPLGIIVSNEYENIMEFEIPGFRPDITIKQDIYEEVARMFGYENIPSRLPIGLTDYVSKSDLKDKKIYELKNILKGIGFREVYTKSLVAQKDVVKEFNLKATPIELLNSLTKGMTHLRVNTLPSFLEICEYNINRGNSDLRFYEFGFIYSRGKEGEHYSVETPILSGVVLGNDSIGHWSNENSSNSIDIYFVKGLISKLLKDSGLKNFSYKKSKREYYDLSVEIMYRGKSIGEFGLVKNDITSEFGVNKEIFHFQIESNYLTSIQEKRAFKEITKFPAVTRELSFVIPLSVDSETVKKKIKKFGGKFLNDIKEIGYFTDDSKLGENLRSISYQMIFIPKDKTFNEKEIDRWFNDIIKGCEKDKSITLRG